MARIKINRDWFFEEIEIKEGVTSAYLTILFDLKEWTLSSINALDFKALEVQVAESFAI